MTNTQSRVHLELTSRTISYAVMKIYFKKSRHLCQITSLITEEIFILKLLRRFKDIAAF